MPTLTQFQEYTKLDDLGMSKFNNTCTIGLNITKSPRCTCTYQMMKTLYIYINKDGNQSTKSRRHVKAHKRKTKTIKTIVMKWKT